MPFIPAAPTVPLKEPAATGTGSLRVLATVQHPLAVQAILAHLARSGAPQAAWAPPASAAIG